MASIFTFEHDGLEVCSPWVTAARRQYPDITRLDDLEPCINTVSRLESEPQTGPVEYKLHLLLRGRRHYDLVTYHDHIPLRQPSKSSVAVAATAAAASSTDVPPSPTIKPDQLRRLRLEQLTTQLLWRLQQSSPHHATSLNKVILSPVLTNASQIPSTPMPGQSLPGISAGKGALYQLGVSDDGTLEGLTEDEMEGSIDNLKSMAACLGCTVSVRRRIVIGEAFWTEADCCDEQVARHNRSSLIVVEAAILPQLSYQDDSPPRTDEPTVRDQKPVTRHPQLRVSLTGSTRSGKSSLLGTLTTSTLDDARGKSRLTMLKHRHEITSGITSSIVQEIIGYTQTPIGDVQLVNYASDHVQSWTDIHQACSDGGVICLTDSAGHPRYRRTIVKGLIGWTPHWVLLCVSANGHAPTMPTDTDVAPVSDDPNRFQMTDITISSLQLCLRLNLPLVIVITKLDAATQSGLRLVLAQLLSILKTAQRRPVVVSARPDAMQSMDMNNIEAVELERIKDLLGPEHGDPFLTVPVVMTSAVQGIGIQSMHALLHELPIPQLVDTPSVAGSLFHIEDVYAKPSETGVTVVAGHLVRGEISIGDDLMLGPCAPCADELEDSDAPTSGTPDRRQSRSDPTELRSPRASISRLTGSTEDTSWISVRVVSLRDLRLPVSMLSPDQVGTIGLQVDPRTGPLRLRKGMVLMTKAGEAAKGFTAAFSSEDLGSLAVGSQVVVYIASIRASARVVLVAVPDGDTTLTGPEPDMDCGEDAECASTHNFPSRPKTDKLTDNEADPPAGSVAHEQRPNVTFRFDTVREYIEIGSKVLVMPGGGPAPRASAGATLHEPIDSRERGFDRLGGFVGRVVECLRP